MEKNGGSCAGKWRFHVLASDNLSTRPKISLRAISVPCAHRAQHVCGQCVFRVVVWRLSVVKARMWPPVLTCGLLSLLGLACCS